MGWLKGKPTGNHRFSLEIWEFPVIFPLNQPIDMNIQRTSEDILVTHMLQHVAGRTCSKECDALRRELHDLTRLALPSPAGSQQGQGGLELCERAHMIIDISCYIYIYICVCVCVWLTVHCIWLNRCNWFWVTWVWSTPRLFPGIPKSNRCHFCAVPSLSLNALKDIPEPERAALKSMALPEDPQQNKIQWPLSQMSQFASWLQSCV